MPVYGVACYTTLCNLIDVVVAVAWSDQRRGR